MNRKGSWYQSSGKRMRILLMFAIFYWVGIRNRVGGRAEIKGSVIAPYLAAAGSTP
jgi:hypothetical protein